MAFEKLQFTKSWENPQDFPTYEPSESQVRADLQLLHDETRDGLNKLVDALNDPTAAAQLPFQGQGLEADSVQGAILEVYGAVQNAAAGQIVNGSITKEKLADALLRRTYGGRPWVSMDTPGAAQNPDADFPIGQAWLRPSFTVENLGGSEWSVSGGTVEAVDGGWKLTGSGAVVTVSLSQSLTGLGAAGDRIFVSLRASDLDSQMTALTLKLNGASQDLSAGGGVYETALDSAGSLALVIAAQWPAASLAVGSATLTHFAVVNADAAEAQLTDCQGLSDWPALLASLVPFSAVQLPEEVYLQATPGNWLQAVYDVLPVRHGGTGLSALDADRYLKTTSGGAMGFLSKAQVIEDLGALRIQTGSYTGTGENRTVTLSVEPKLLVIWPDGGPVNNQNNNIEDNPIVLGNGAMAEAIISSGSSASYSNTISLSGASLTFQRKGVTSSITNPVTKYGNRSGVTYNWVAVY